MKSKSLHSLLILALGLLAMPLYGQQAPALRIATVDLARAYDTYFKTEQANVRFREAAQRAQEQLDEMNAQGNALLEEYRELMEQSQNSMLSNEARERSERQAQDRLQDIQRMQNEVQQFRLNTQRSLEQRQRTHRDLMFDEIRDVITEIAEARGVTLVLDSSGPTVIGAPTILFANRAYDITEEVIRVLNRDRPTN